MKQKLTEYKGEIVGSTVIVGDFNTLLTVMNRTRQKISKEIKNVNNSINK